MFADQCKTSVHALCNMLWLNEDTDNHLIFLPTFVERGDH